MAENSLEISSNTTPKLTEQTTAARWQVRAVQPCDGPEVRDLFAEVFGTKMSESQYAWKYGAGQCQGHGSAVGVWDEKGTLVAHCGGFPRVLRQGTRRHPVMQIGDVMVARRARGVLTRRGPFFQAVTSYFANNLAPAGGADFAFGFPSKRHLDLGQHLELYAAVDPVQAVCWNLWPGERFGWRHAVRQVPSIAVADARCIATLADAMASDLAPFALIERDSDYLNFRYAGCAELGYRIYMVHRRFQGEILGIFVLRPLAGTNWELLDVLARVRDMPTILRAARVTASAHGAISLSCWATPRPASVFAACGAAVTATDVEIAVSIWPDDSSSLSMRGLFWLTSGDTDFR